MVIFKCYIITYSESMIYYLSYVNIYFIFCGENIPLSLLVGYVKSTLMHRFFYFTLLCSIFFSATSLSAATYDDDVLDMFSKIAPRLILMSSQKDRLKEKIEICILHDKIDEAVKTSLMGRIQSSYPNGIKNYPIKLIDGDYTHIDLCKNSHLLFMLNTNEENIKYSLKYAAAHSSLTMSYDPSLLTYGVNASLFLGRKVTPYLNLDSTQKNKIEFDNLLIRISKIYLNEGEK